MAPDPWQAGAQAKAKAKATLGKGHSVRVRAAPLLTLWPRTCCRLRRLAGEMVCRSWHAALYHEPVGKLSLRSSPEFWSWLERRRPAVAELDLNGMSSSEYAQLEICCEDRPRMREPSEATLELKGSLSRALQQDLDGQVGWGGACVRCRGAAHKPRSSCT